MLWKSEKKNSLPSYIVIGETQELQTRELN